MPSKKKGLKNRFRVYEIYNNKYTSFVFESSSLKSWVGYFTENINKHKQFCIVNRETNKVISENTDDFRFLVWVTKEIKRHKIRDRILK